MYRFTSFAFYHVFFEEARDSHHIILFIFFVFVSTFFLL